MPAGFFEAVVRPSVFPDVRPRPAQQPPALQAEDRIFEVDSGNGKVLQLTHSLSSSFSRSTVTELERTFDEVRLTNPDGGGEHIDAEIAHKFKMRDQNGDTARRTYRRPAASPTVQILSTDNKR